MSEKVQKMIPDELIQDIKNSDKAVLFTHSHPDGDALGSILGLRAMLESCDKEVFCLIEEQVSHLYSFLPEIDTLSTSVEEYQQFIKSGDGDLISIALDCGDDDRLGDLKEKVLGVTPFWVIDHHQSHRNFGTGRWVDATRSSTGEMVYELGLRLGADVSYNTAFNLYVAIYTDTGSFRYESTGQRTMEIGGELIAKGVRPDIVGSHIYDNFSKERLKLMELALGSITLHGDESIAFMSVTRKMLGQSGASLKDVEGFINLPRSLVTVKVAVLFKEAQHGQISVSMRAKGECNVASIAKQFGGGGHKNAAGFRQQDKTIEEVQSELLSALQLDLSQN